MSLPTEPSDVQALIARLRALSASASNDAEARAIARQISQISRAYRLQHGIGLPASPIVQAVELDSGYRRRSHLDYLSERIRMAVRDVERGQNRLLAVSMPPRTGKSTLLSQQTPLWLLRRHPEWSIITASHDGALTGEWARSIRQTIETKPTLGVSITPDGGAGTRWTTDEGGGLFATSVQGPITGRGARVMIIDDPVKDFVDAHSEVHRQRLWNWWLSVAQTRLEPPYLVIVVMTRWHEDDFIGRLLSPDHEGDPRAWEYVRLSAIAGEDDILDRPQGDPLYSPLLDETRSEALDRWADTRRAVGTYTWSALYQQTPSPARGAIFDSAWWRFWTRDPEKVTEDGRVAYLEPSTLTGGHWLDSWDCAFKSSPKDVNSGGWVVGQRWVRDGANRYLIAQQRGRWSFTETIARMQRWAVTDNPGVSPCGHLVHERHIEERANGAAIIDTLKDHVSGIKPINPTISKEARARAITPEIESGHVYLPHPSDPGNEWVADLLSELRNFPHDMADDQVDALTQGLNGLRDTGRAGLTIPGQNAGQRLSSMSAPRNIARAAMTDRRVAGRRSGGPR